MVTCTNDFAMVSKMSLIISWYRLFFLTVYNKTMFYSSACWQLLLIVIVVVVSYCWCTRPRYIGDIPPRSVVLVTYEDRDLEYVSLHNHTTQQYSDCWGYEYQFLRSHPNPLGLPAYWQKLSVILALLQTRPDVEIVCWLDSDAFVTQPQVPLTDLLDESGSIYISKDHPLDNRSAFCAGVFILKNNTVSRAFVQACLDHYTGNAKCRDDAGRLALNGAWAGECYEQGVMNQMLNTPKFLPYLRDISPDMVRNSFDFFPQAVISHVYGPNKPMGEIYRAYGSSKSHRS